VAVTVRIIVEDITAQLLTYDTIELERSATVGGTYSQVATEALSTGVFYYTIGDSTGTLNDFYRYRFHKTTPLANSDYSDPFRVEGVTRLRARQAALAKYGAGIVVVNTGTDTNKITTADHRVNTSLFGADRGTPMQVSLGYF